jgi:hypothetical protein
MRTVPDTRNVSTEPALSTVVLYNIIGRSTCKRVRQLQAQEARVPYNTRE